MRTHWSRSRRRDGTDRGSMPLALLITMVSVGLSALLSTVIIGQVDATRRVEHRVQALNAAQAGLDVALAGIRLATTPVIGGDRAKLPCTLPASALGETGRYEVTIDYFTIDPDGYQWDTTPIEDRRVPCTPGSGTSTTPGYALLRSRGTACYCDADGDGHVSDDEPDWRRLHATYTLNTTDEKLLGGEIQVFSLATLCIGTNVAPDDGTPLVAVDCDRTDRARKLFAYPPSLQLRLTDSRTAARPEGLCIEAPAAVVDTALVLRPCADGTMAAQRWQFRGDTFVFEGTSDNVESNGLCFNLKVADTVNTPIVLRSGPEYCTRDAVSMGRFQPTAAVGPGNAGVHTKQLVNSGEVGRCLDVPEDDVTGDRSREEGEGDGVITYPCKQMFSGLPHWNHVWTVPAIPEGGTQVTGRIVVTPGDAADPEHNVPYCLSTPGAGWSGAQSYVWVERCSTANPADITWTIYGKTPLVQDAYRIVDSYGNCMQSIANPTPAQQQNAWTRVVVRPCDGSYYQKWNAPPNVVNDPLKDYGE
jgi:hypothetical protein